MAETQHPVVKEFITVGPRGDLAVLDLDNIVIARKIFDKMENIRKGFRAKRGRSISWEEMINEAFEEFVNRHDISGGGGHRSNEHMPHHPEFQFARKYPLE